MEVPGAGKREQLCGSEFIPKRLSFSLRQQGAEHPRLSVSVKGETNLLPSHLHSVKGEHVLRFLGVDKKSKWHPESSYRHQSRNSVKPCINRYVLCMCLEVMYVLCVFLFLPT